MHGGRNTWGRSGDEMRLEVFRTELRALALRLTTLIALIAGDRADALALRCRRRIRRKPQERG